MTDVKFCRRCNVYHVTWWCPLIETSVNVATTNQRPAPMTRQNQNQTTITIVLKGGAQ